MTADPAVTLGIALAAQQLGIDHLEPATPAEIAAAVERFNEAAEAPYREQWVRDRGGCECYPTPILDSITATLLRERDEARAECERLRSLLKGRAA